MDKREALQPGSQLRFPGLLCTIESEIGRGSNAIVYRAWYTDSHHEDERHQVLVKELFPLHLNGAIYRAQSGDIVCDPEGIETFKTHQRSFEEGNRVHLEIQRKHPDEVGANLNTFPLNDTLYTLLGFNNGRTLSDELTGPVVRLRPFAERIIKLLNALEGFHDSGLLHLDIAPDNIMLMGRNQQERVMLIDYNSCQKRETAGEASAIFSIKQGFTAPEIRSGRYREIGPRSDLYSIAAILFLGVTGKALTPFQIMRPLPPDVSACPCLADAPETVKHWIQSILRKGLSTLPSRRYQSVAEMREDLQELLDRIDGVGITHWALWESGWRNIDRLIHDNPALGFLRNVHALYPSNVAWERGVQPFSACLEHMLSDGGNHALLIAPGGMGKTTAMLRTVFSQIRTFSPAQPAIAYLSMAGWQTGDRNAILNRLLETLRYKSETHNFEDARKTLLELLDRPLQGSGGTRPVLLMLLDGLNEVAGDISGLIDEINRLSKARGVRILITSRSDEAALPFERLRLIELGKDDVQAALSQAGLLMPESPEMQTLLRTPLMLSIFIRSSLAEQKQLTVATRDELMQAYLAALLEKELQGLPESADECRQIEVALYLVLPMLARELHRQGRALTDLELLPVVQRGYRILNGRLSQQAFPQWIGHRRAIFGEKSTLDDWYDKIVHNILWRRLGLLLRDDQSRYQVVHQIIGEYLLGIEAENRRHINRLHRVQNGMKVTLGVSVVLAAVLVYYFFIRPMPYDAASAERVFREAVTAYMDSGLECEDMQDLLICANDAPDSYAQAAERLRWDRDATTARDQALNDLKEMLKTGSVMPWSGKPMDQRSCELLLALPSSIADTYTVIINEIRALLADGSITPEFKRLYIWAISEVIHRDTRIIADLYMLACEPHMTGKYSDTATVTQLSFTDAGDAEGSAVIGQSDFSVYIPLTAEQTQDAMNRPTDEIQDELTSLSNERSEILDVIMNYR